MKKIILIAVLAVITNASFAQVSFGVQVGPNFSMDKLKFNEAQFSPFATHTQKNKMKVGILGGFVVEIPIGSSLAFRPEINFVQHGTKQTTVETDGVDFTNEEYKINLNYIQVPLNVVYKMPAGGGSLFFGLGPAIEIGLSGKAKYKYTDNFGTPAFENTSDVKFDGKKSDDLSSGDNDAHLKRVNVAANVLVGYKLAMGVFAKLGYTYGFMDIDPNKKNNSPTNQSSYKSSGFNLSIGYMFGGSKSSKKSN